MLATGSQQRARAVMSTDELLRRVRHLVSTRANTVIGLSVPMLLLSLVAMSLLGRAGFG